MDLTLTEEQKFIKDTAQKFIKENFSFEKRCELLSSGSETADDINKKFSELGWLGLHISEKEGGFGGSVSDVMTLVEAIGTGMLIESFTNNILFAGKILERFISNKYSKDLLKDLMGANKKFSVAIDEPGNKYNYSNCNTKFEIKEKIILNGHKTFVLGANKADFIIVNATGPSNEVGCFVIPRTSAQIEINSYKTIDDISAADVFIKNLVIENDKSILKISKAKEFNDILDYIIDYVTLAVCSEALGVIDKMYESTLEYVKTREQFGRKIGSFQVIQHRLVDMYIKKEEMRSLNYMGQIFLDKTKEERNKKISLNKIFLGTHAKSMAQDCIQLHGGMGVADEMEVGHYFKKITTLSNLFGNADYHFDRYSKM